MNFNPDDLNRMKTFPLLVAAGNPGGADVAGQALSAWFVEPGFTLIEPNMGLLGIALFPFGTRNASHEELLVEVALSAGQYAAPIQITKKSRIEKWKGSGNVRIGPRIHLHQPISR